MRTVKIVAEHAPFVLVRQGNRYAVVERRNARFYELRGGVRTPVPMSDSGFASAVGDNWCSESTARHRFADIVTRYTELAERMR